ncbi:plastocyanin/azurin family copper-binding protein [Nibrella saemangeumensis]
MARKLMILLLGLLSTAAWAQTDTTIIIRAVTGLKYDPPRLVIQPGRQLRLILKNDDDMAHNLVITKPNSRLRVVEFALALGDKGAQQHYVPNMDEVLAHTRIVEPGHADTLTIKLTDGEYPFVCTYPGHGYVMYGMLYVTRDPKRLPPADRDPNLPNAAPNAHASHTTAPAHPYALTFPAMYRTFMPDCGPAAIAVGLPAVNGGPQQSYCWDAGSCRLRYAWSGGFVDNNEHWSGKGQLLTKVVGEIFYREKTGFPWRIGSSDTVPEPRFLGYRLVSRYPEFRYRVGDIDVRELIRPVVNGRGFVRQFTLSPSQQALTFLTGTNDGMRYKASVGKLAGNKLILPPGTRQFTLTMTAL